MAAVADPAAAGAAAMDATETAIATSTDAAATAEAAAWTRFPCDWSKPPARVAQSLNAPRGQSADPLFCNAHKVVAWTVDGQLLLTTSEDNVARVYHLPPEIWSLPEDQPPVALNAAVNVEHGEVVYDAVWFPAPAWGDPTASCFATTSKDHPIVLWNAADGSMRCSYQAMDHMDELASAISLAFTADGTELLTGFENCVRIFSTAQPGRTCDVLQTTPTRRSKDGQKGLIGALAAPPSGNAYFLAGSYNGSIALYDAVDRTGVPVWLIPDAHPRGVTQHVMLDQVSVWAADPTYFLSGGRKDEAVLAWDMRMVSQPVCQWPRAVPTNQRISFDLDAAGQYLLLGQANGGVDVYDVHASLAQGAPAEPLLRWTAHQHTVVAARANPMWPLVATGAGQRRIDLLDDDPEAATPIDQSLCLWRASAPWTTAAGAS